VTAAAHRVEQVCLLLLVAVDVNDVRFFLTFVSHGFASLFDGLFI
jgi:hypothetical protein